MKQTKTQRSTKETNIRTVCIMFMISHSSETFRANSCFTENVSIFVP